MVNGVNTNVIFGDKIQHRDSSDECLDDAPGDGLLNKPEN